ncbi:MAG: hypothetical protein ALECFALPRED_006557 [Alectoria fallacina]|uniref:Uncharacterized protein n=1 Tax=Alectoria fallacina TaxID=1903189 RepID=A0A8H3IPR1_9LECA|nr:MAG: hypothetical protein ALECFALPRED_006557 [Alectoria fallacina]
MTHTIFQCQCRSELEWLSIDASSDVSTASREHHEFLKPSTSRDSSEERKLQSDDLKQSRPNLSETIDLAKFKNPEQMKRVRFELAKAEVGSRFDEKVADPFDQDRQWSKKLEEEPIWGGYGPPEGPSGTLHPNAFKLAERDPDEFNVSYDSDESIESSDSDEYRRHKILDKIPNALKKTKKPKNDKKHEQPKRGGRLNGRS